MLSIQDLRQRRAAKAKEMSDLVNKTTWDKEKDTPVYDAGMAEIEDLDSQIKRITDVNARLVEDNTESRVIEAGARAARDNPSRGVELFNKWLRGGDTALNADDWRFMNTMSTTTTTEGGYTVATEVATQVLDALKQYGGMRAVANVLRTTEGNPINFPTSDGTAEVGELIGENTTATAADIVFGVKTLTTYKYSSKVVAVPFELLQDSSVDIEAFVRTRLVTRLGRITNTHFTIGTGSGQPNGVVTAAGAGKVGTTGQTGTIIYDDLVDLMHAVDPAYRALNNCRFMLHDSSIKQIRKIKDTVGRPIFTPGYESTIDAPAPFTIPDQLMGYPIQINQDIAAMAANAKSVLFGDFSFYTIRDVMDVSMFRFTDSAYTKLGQVGFLAWMRSGGQFVDVGGSVKYYQNSAT